MTRISFNILALSILLPWLSNAVVAQYDIRKLPVATRRSLCDKNVAFCTNACNQKVTANSCSVDSMQWECTCETPSSISYHYFPIQAQQCIGENGDCRTKCVQDGATRNQTAQEIGNCAVACDRFYVCGTPNAGESKNFTAGGDIEPLEPTKTAVGNSTVTATATAPNTTITTSIPTTTATTDGTTPGPFSGQTTSMASISTTTRTPTATFTWVSSGKSTIDFCSQTRLVGVLVVGLVALVGLTDIVL